MVDSTSCKTIGRAPRLKKMVFNRLAPLAAG